MTRTMWIKSLGQFAQYGSPTEKRLAQLSLDLILHPHQVEQILDRTAQEILDDD